jgi:hypothetical protein
MVLERPTVASTPHHLSTIPQTRENHRAWTAYGFHIDAKVIDRPTLTESSKWEISAQGYNGFQSKNWSL